MGDVRVWKSGPGWCLYIWDCPKDHCPHALISGSRLALTERAQEHADEHAAIDSAPPVKPKAKCNYCQREVLVWTTGELRGIVRSHRKTNGLVCPGSLRRGLNVELAR